MSPAPLPSARRIRRQGLFTSRGVSLTARILAVNIIVIGLIAFSLFYIDAYRRQVVDERFKRARSEAEIIADALSRLDRADRHAMLATIGTRQRLRLRLYDAHGKLVADSFRLAPPSFTLADPTTQPWYMKAARTLDRGMDVVLGAPDVPPYRDSSGAALWPEVAQARSSGHTVVDERYAPDRTPVISAATPVENGEVLLAMHNAPDITQSVRDARQALAIVVALALLVTVFLSLFLARTIVQPLRVLVRAAVRVRLGRERAVVVPRLPERGDEIGLLARALADMSEALRQRIDAVESFAADVAHEIKNPLASLRSALEAMGKVDDPALRAQLMDITAHDVQRLDRLVTEIADASRIDAELSRTTFEQVDLAALAMALVGAREARKVNAGCQLRVVVPEEGVPAVAGDAARLERVLENLLDNAVSFSPPGGWIELRLSSEGDTVVVEVSDEGPGIPPIARERVFERFHSLRPAGEDFGHHSGLGLAIARTIITAHEGTLTARDPRPGHKGARLVVELAALEPHGDSA